MPGFDGTGPAGAGKLMGRGMGPCGNDGSTDTASCLGRGMGLYSGLGMRCSPGFGRGRGMGFGRGFGLGIGPGLRPHSTDGNETAGGEELKAVLSEQKNYLKARLDAIDKRLETL